MGGDNGNAVDFNVLEWPFSGHQRAHMIEERLLVGIGATVKLANSLMVSIPVKRGPDCRRRVILPIQRLRCKTKTLEKTRRYPRFARNSLNRYKEIMTSRRVARSIRKPTLPSQPPVSNNRRRQ
jgi:hypothetical protein